MEDFDVTTAKKAFTEKFVHSNNFMDEFQNHIKYCLDTCKKDPSYAPYFALIQSSGYGKSHLIAKLAQNIYVVYNQKMSMDILFIPALKYDEPFAKLGKIRNCY